ncbi:MAG: DUF2752 domain-containing protein [Balneolaceae bacterium]|nr:MAG: DUF2752 domain-containing protein [Balneolaceae bacterium]
MLTKPRLYGLVMALAAASYGLLAYFYHNANGSISAQVCPINRVAGIPCPSCGTARSIVFIMEGNLYGAMMTNPLGFLAALLLIALPVWVALDFVRKRESLYRSYLKTEAWLIRRKWVAALLVVLILANWIWNITKGL